MRITLLAALVLLLSILHSVNFTSVLIGEAGEDNPGLATMDFDLDNDLDIIVSKNSTDQIIIYENTGDWENPPQHIVVENFDPQYLYSANMNNDIYPDIIASSAAEGLVSIFYTTYINDTLSFIREDVAEGITGAHRVIAKDINNDGNIDVICASAGLGAIFWWEKEDSDWIDHQVTDEFPGCQAICVEDMNNDTYPDIVGASMDNDEIAVWYNSGTEVITWQKQQHDSSFVRAHWVSIADINNDGLPDILGAAFTSDEISWWENDGQIIESWQKHVISNNINGPVTVEPAYLNDDDQIDLVGTCWSSCRVYYWLQEEGDFNQTQLAYQQWGAWPIAVGDFDGDNKTDFAVGCDVLGANATSSPLTLWINDTIVKTEENQLQQGYFNFYPNPVSNIINIESNNREFAISKFEIFNIKGEKVTEKVLRGDVSNLSINLENQNYMPNGIYLIKIITAEESMLRKFIVLR